MAGGMSGTVIQFQCMPLRRIVTPLLGLCLLALLGLAFYATQAVANSSATPSYAEYRNNRWHFSLLVPDDMKAVVDDQPGGGQTIQFHDATGDKELQITAYPYSQLDVTLGREGEAGSTHDQPNRLEIVDVIRDDRFTVLFEKNGVRYVVITLPEQDAWLREILATWHFI